MIEQITPSYKFICDRCGKEKIIVPGEVKPYITVSFQAWDEEKHGGKDGQVCIDCGKEFVELGNNFFSEVNKENND